MKKSHSALRHSLNTSSFADGISGKIRNAAVIAMMACGFISAKAAGPIVNFTVTSGTELSAGFHWSVDLSKENIADLHSIAVNDDKIYLTQNQGVSALSENITLACYDAADGRRLDDVVLTLEGVSPTRMMTDGGCNGAVMICNDDAGNVVVCFDSSSEGSLEMTLSRKWFYGVADFDAAIIKVKSVDYTIMQLPSFKLIGWGQPDAIGDVAGDDFCIGANGWISDGDGKDFQLHFTLSSGSYFDKWSASYPQNDMLAGCSPLSSNYSDPTAGMIGIGDRSTFCWVNDGDLFVADGAAGQPYLFQSSDPGRLGEGLSQHEGSMGLDAGAKGFHLIKTGDEKLAVMATGDASGSWKLADWTAVLPPVAANYTSKDWAASDYTNWMNRFTPLLTLDSNEAAVSDTKTITPAMAAPTATPGDTTGNWQPVASAKTAVNDTEVNDLYLYAPGNHLTKYRIGDREAVASVNALDDNSGESTVYYTLQGLRLSGRPTLPGLYIARAASSTTKILIR